MRPCASVPHSCSRAAGCRRRVASMGSSTALFVRPAVMVYGRTMRAVGSSSEYRPHGSGSVRDMAVVLSDAREVAGLGLDHPADPLDEEGHLIAHLADVGGVLGEDGEVRPVADAH